MLCICRNSEHNLDLNTTWLIRNDRNTDEEDIFDNRDTNFKYELCQEMCTINDHIKESY